MFCLFVCFSLKYYNWFCLKCAAFVLYKDSENVNHINVYCSPSALASDFLAHQVLGAKELENDTIVGNATIYLIKFW